MPDPIDDAEDAEDRRELAAARADDDYVLWDEVKVALELGVAVTSSRSRATTDEGGNGHGRN